MFVSKRRYYKDLRAERDISAAKTHTIDIIREDVIILSEKNKALSEKVASLGDIECALRSRLDRAISGNKAQQETIVARERELDDTRQELDAWKKRCDQLATISCQLAKAAFEKDEAVSEMSELLDEAADELEEADEALDALLAELETAKSPEKKGKRNG